MTTPRPACGLGQRGARDRQRVGRAEVRAGQREQPRAPAGPATSASAGIVGQQRVDVERGRRAGAGHRDRAARREDRHGSRRGGHSRTGFGAEPLLPLCAPPHSATRRLWRHSHDHEDPARHRPTASTTLATSTTPVASRSSRAWTTSPTHEVVEHGPAGAREPRAPRRRRAPTRAPATAPGCSLQMPDAFFRASRRLRAARPRPLRRRRLLPADRRPTRRAKLEELLELNVRVEGQRVLGWRDVPVDDEHVGETANQTRPVMRQLFVEAGPGLRERPGRLRAQALRHPPHLRARRRARTSTSPRSPRARSSTRGCSSPTSCAASSPTCSDERMASAMALVHSRFSTNTFPSWALAHPYRVIAHNGEINTLMGNVNWMRARESQLASELFGLRPAEDHADRRARRLGLGDVRQRARAAHARRPLAAARGDDDDPGGLRRTATTCPTTSRASTPSTPASWSRGTAPPRSPSPTARVVGATLDRNGLRPGRWVETHDGLVVLGSEAGLLPIRRHEIKRLGRLQPGKLFLVDLERDRIVEDEEVKREVADAAALRRVVRAATPSTSTTSPEAHVTMTGVAADAPAPARLRLHAGGPARADRADGRDRRRADRLDGQRQRARRCCPTAARRCSATSSSSSRRSPTRRSTRSARTIVMSLGDRHRRRAQPARRDARARPPARHGPADPAQPRARDAAQGRRTTIFRAHTIDITWPVERRRRGHAEARWPSSATRPTTPSPPASTSSSCPTAGSGPSAWRSRRCSPSPPSTTTSCARARACARASCSSPASRARSTTWRRSSATARARSTRTCCSTPSTSWSPRAASRASTTPTTAERNIVKAIGKGLLKTISKMGISTTQSYCGAQIFEAVGLEQRPHRPPLHRHRVADRRHRHRRARARDARPPRRAPTRPTTSDAAARRRRLRLAPRRRAPHVEPGDDRAAAARGARRRTATRRTKYDEYARARQRRRHAHARRCAG